MTKVNTYHPNYHHWYAKANKDRMFLAGEEEVKNAGEYFLPRLSGQTKTEYHSMLDRTLFFGAARRTHSALLGLVHRKPAVIEIDQQYRPLTENMDLSKDGHFDIFAKDVTSELLSVGRAVICVDYDDMAQRPYASLYKGDCLINQRYDDMTGELSLAVLSEVHEVPIDEFETAYVTKYRVKKIENGIFIDCLYAPDDKGDYYLESEMIPQRLGSPLTYIPMTVINNTGLGCTNYEDSILHDLISVNVNHYQTSADLSTVLHFSALPTLTITGVSDTDTHAPVHLGSTSAILLPPGTDAKILEFTGSSASQLKEHLQELEARMSVLGSRILNSQESRPQTATAESIRSAAEQTTLHGVVSTIEHGIEHVIKDMMYWDGAEDAEVIVRFNRDYNANKLDASMLASLTKAFNEGAIDRDTYLYNLEQGEMLPPAHNNNKTSVVKPRHMDQMIEAGMTDEEIVEMHPTVPQAEINAAREQYDG